MKAVDQIARMFRGTPRARSAERTAPESSAQLARAFAFERTRDRSSVRYAATRLDRLCRCGHSLGEHTAAVAAGERHCLAEGCSCTRFTRPRAKGAP